MTHLTKLTISADSTTRNRLAALALNLGYTDPRHGGGSVSALLRAIASGELHIKKEKEMAISWHEMAEQRVRNSKALRQHEATIMYDWPEGDEHWRWVATATVKEIVDWVETVEQK